MDRPAVTVLSKQRASKPRERSRLDSGIPWLALVSLLLVLICIGASIGIIVISNGQTVDSWKVQPSVLLAILTSISNLALGTAFSTAVVITWWTSAIDGASLSQLHYIWDRGEGLSFFSALAAGADARRVLLASSIIGIVKLSTNPLLQQATHQKIDEIVLRESIKLNSAQYISDAWFGSINSSTSQYPYASETAGTIFRDWWKNATIHSDDAPGYYCDGTCEGNVPGAGIHYNCSSTTQTLNLLAPNDDIVFSVNSTVSQNSIGGSLLLTTVYLSAVDETCTATLTIETCEIEAGIVEYPVILQKSTIMLDPVKLDNVTVLSTYIYPGDSPVAGNVTSLNALHQLFGTYVYANGSSSSTDSGMALGEMFVQVQNHVSYPKCPFYWWSSPTNYALNSMQNIMFRTALRAANSTDTQTFTVLRTKPVLVFHTTYGYLAAASVIALLGLLITLMMIQGWWVLGRTVTLSPLETVRAFSAPLMERAGYRVDDVLEDLGQRWVKYVDGVMTVQADGDIVRPVIEEGQIHHDGAKAEGGNDERSPNTNSQSEALDLSSSR